MYKKPGYVPKTITLDETTWLTKPKRKRPGQNLGELSAVIVADDSVSDTETMDVSHHALQPVCICVISHNHACVPHELSCITQIIHILASYTLKHFNITL